MPAKKVGPKTQALIDQAADVAEARLKAALRAEAGSGAFQHK
jgi:hypothetical protein